MNGDMNGEFPRFDSEEELREWFDSADLSVLSLDKALDAVVANHVELSLSDSTGVGSNAGMTGTLREFHLVNR